MIWPTVAGPAIADLPAAWVNGVLRVLQDIPWDWHPSSEIAREAVVPEHLIPVIIQALDGVAEHAKTVEDRDIYRLRRSRPSDPRRAATDRPG